MPSKECNIILAQTYEYRLPSSTAIKEAAVNAEQSPSSPDTVKADMTSRYLGLIVVPGQHVTRIEVEES